MSLKIIVTGAAGFIGSHLCSHLVENGAHTVIGIDGIIDPTLKKTKDRNIAKLVCHPQFTLMNENLLTIDWRKTLTDVDVIFHLAGMPGVRSSWGEQFELYTNHNITATQRLLEACKQVPLKHFIYASTSSVYGDCIGRVSEDSKLAPLSPYGVSKLTGEYLCKVYEANDGLPLTILRYFTVYGPRQRQDMAFHRFIKALIKGEPISVYGDGTQTRDFTYISDCIAGTAAVLQAKNSIGETINLGGKERKSILDIIQLLEIITDKKAVIDFIGATRGEPKHTWADITKAEALLKYHPSVPLNTGLFNEFIDLQTVYKEDIAE